VPERLGVEYEMKKTRRHISSWSQRPSTGIIGPVTNNWDAIWSGACSSGGNKTKTSTFIISAKASVTANVQ
jgi:hypothetical protein